MNNEQELKKKLAEWAGFKFYEDWHYPEKGWYTPDNRKLGFCIADIDGLPNFTTSLDACFKWLVPKVATNLELTVAFHRCHGNIWSCLFTTYQGDIAIEPCKHTNPALALCLAIEKLIDSEAK